MESHINKKMNIIRTLPIAFTIQVFFLTACSAISVQSLRDDAVDVSKYKRFAVIEPSSFPPNADPRVNAITMRKINDTIAEELVLRGFTKVPKEEADFLVASYADIKGKIDISSYGYHYSYYGHYGNWGINDIAVREYDEGTLVIDFIDAGTQSMIWRGWATGRISDEPSLERLRQSVGTVLDRFPPF